MQEKPSLNLFSMDIAHPMFILILVAAGVKLASVWLRLESFSASPGISIQLESETTLWDNPVSPGLKDLAGQG